MIIEISADTVVWYIAIMLTILSFLGFFILMALRVLTAVLMTELQGLRKKIPSMGGGGGGGDGGGGLGSMLGPIVNMFTGGK